MAHLIVGHTTHRSTRIWVHDEKSSKCRITLSAVPKATPPPPDPDPQVVRLGRAAGRTSTAIFKVHPATQYQVKAEFASAVATGRFRTMEDPAGTRAIPFSFVLASCNLPVVAVNNLLAYLLAMGGAAAVRRSFDLPLARWNLWRWVAFVARWAGRAALPVAGLVVKCGNRARQPPPPYLRSPFLKLHAVFEAHILDLEEAKLDTFPAVGDRIQTRSGCGYVVSLEKTSREQRIREQERRKHRRRGPRARGNAERRPAQEARAEKEHGTCTLVVTHVCGTFHPGQTLAIDTRDNVQLRVHRACRASPWYANPAFFIHAGDQIYFDFPDPVAAPARKAYRRAYQEAWLDDASASHVLAHWPHYMTLDDHEIADQFSNDFQAPREGVTREQYKEEALAAYDEYVAPRNPAFPNSPSQQGRTRYWYRFDRGRAHFFVLDTRTERCTTEHTMIGVEQMRALLDWLRENQDDPKFVVTSVPFVAEFDTKVAEQHQDWYDRRGGNPANDKWSAPEFRSQRSAIIEHIDRYAIEHVVFLTGDMHCCYHAMMRIGCGSKHERIAVHELGSGPLNQLQLPSLSEFRTRRTGTTAGDPCAHVAYEVTLEQFHSQVSAVMHITISYGAQDPASPSDGAGRPRLTWNVIRTVTDVGVEGWSRDGQQGDGVGRTPSPGETTPRARVDLVSNPSARRLQRW